LNHFVVAVRTGAHNDSHKLDADVALALVEGHLEGVGGKARVKSVTLFKESVHPVTAFARREEGLDRRALLTLPLAALASPLTNLLWISSVIWLFRIV
jgi:hypothetical protein